MDRSVLAKLSLRPSRKSNASLANLSQWNSTSEWRSLLLFRHKLIRDLAFVLFCPQLLSDSTTLPAVNFHRFPGQRSRDPESWNSEALEWLLSLDEEIVEDWFRSNQRNSRLGDHFANCVEHLLRFCPLFQPQNLHISVQVHQTNLIPIPAAAAGSEKRRNSEAERTVCHVTTLGEYDILFHQHSAARPPVPNPRTVHHWEVSVKFLLFVGPWDFLQAHNNNTATHRAINGAPCDPNLVLSWYLGPHVGESLLDRKERLERQLKLGFTPLGRAKIQELFELEASRGDVSSDLSPAVLVQGYLFYEYPLWIKLRNRGFGIKSEGNGCHGWSPTVGSCHWSGWWTCDPIRLVNLPENEGSKWYVIPKLEWLSLVVIRGDKCGLLLSGEGLLEYIEEVKKNEMPRKQRALVAQMEWVPNCEMEGGDWVERSRGFVVENVWPNSEHYRPRGFKPCWVSL